MKLKIKWFKSGSRLNNLGQAIVSGALQETQSAFNLTSFCNSTKFSWNSISPLGGNSKRNNKHPDFFFFFNSFWEQCWLQYWDWTPAAVLGLWAMLGWCSCLQEAAAVLQHKVQAGTPSLVPAAAEQALQDGLGQKLLCWFKQQCACRCGN